MKTWRWSNVQDTFEMYEAATAHCDVIGAEDDFTVGLGRPMCMISRLPNEVLWWGVA
jgi:hypothetical protein